ncbi:SCAN domain-containing protein 3-like [Oratosquilla oratoria]|uniref:SCAN domain-containing protein 3-like n=1 Tax=Oratosquilla oratoria TaxID=337810 RepID=UPI003F76DD4C
MGNSPNGPEFLDGKFLRTSDIASKLKYPNCLIEKSPKVARKSYFDDKVSVGVSKEKDISVLNYGFTEIEDKGQMKPQCVSCMKILTAKSFKKNQLKKHLDKVHSHLSSKPREYFENLEKTVKRQRLESNKSATFDQRSAAIASFEVAWLVARNKKPHTIGEDLIKPAAVKMAERMCGQKVAKQMNTVPLSARVIKERISILAENVREQVISSVKKK